MKFYKILTVVLFFICMSSQALAGQIVVIETSKGVIEVELDADKAPVTVKNFLEYVDAGFYDGLIFHRVIPGFMVQGGGMDENMQQKSTNAPIKIESNNGLKNLKGTIAMARTNDPNSATAQFFINLVDNAFLDYRDSSRDGAGYTVFGKTVAGSEVVDTIAKVPTGRSGMHSDVPKEVVKIISINKK